MKALPGKILLRLDKKYTDEIITEGGLHLYLDPSFRPEWNCTVSGKIAAVSSNSPYHVGDKVYFSYQVVHTRTFRNDSDYFVRTLEGSEYVREYSNALGQTIRVKARMGAISKKWHGILVDKDFELLDGVQGTESDVERWLSQFKFGSNDNLVYENLIEIDGKDYWIADESQLFAVEIAKEIYPVNDYIFLKPIEIDITEMLALCQQESRVIPNTKIRMEGQGKVKYGKAFRQNQIVYYHPSFGEKYEINGENLVILKRKRILATA